MTDVLRRLEHRYNDREKSMQGHNEKMMWRESESEVAQSCLTLCDPMDCSLPGSSIHGIFQAIVLEWIAISFSRGSSRPRDRTQVSGIVDRHVTDVRRKWPQTSQEKKPQRKPSLSALWFFISSLQYREKINFCCLSHPIFGYLLWQS